MAPRMVTNFRRSLSFPNPPPSHTTSSSSSSSKPRKALHVRSTSLPCRSHPIISQLRDEVAELNSWSQAGSRTTAWLCDGLSRLKAVHESLDDLLQLPQTRESLHGSCEYYALIEKLLEDFLRFVDVYGMFQSFVLRLKEEYSAMQMAVRRKDESKVVTSTKNMSKIAKEVGKLVPSVLTIGKLSTVAQVEATYEYEAQLVDVINDVLKVTVTVSVALFGGLSSSLSLRRASCMGLSFGRKVKGVGVEVGIEEFRDICNLESLIIKIKKGDDEVKMASKKMHELEDCVVEIEGCGERAFRSLINSRVSLLNVLTQ